MKRFCCVMLSLALLMHLAAPVFAFEKDFGYKAVVGNLLLPLDEYPLGSYCTTTGEPCTSAHNDCLRYYTTPDGETVDTLGWQCMGFARYVFYRLFGVVDYRDDHDVGYHSVIRNLSVRNLDAEQLRTRFDESVRAGAHIRVGNSSTGHSLIFLGSDETYVYTYEGNYMHTCEVTVHQWTWEELRKFALRKGGITYVHMPDVYPEQMNWDCAQSDHVWSMVERVYSTCVVNGEETYRCIYCGEKRQESLPLVEHSYVKTVMDFVTPQSAGTARYTCSVCGSAYDEPIAPLGVCDGGSACYGAAMTDMPKPDNWAHGGIEFALANGLFNGTSETTFSPSGTMTRAMLVTVLYRLNNTLEKTPDTPTYSTTPTEMTTPTTPTVPTVSEATTVPTLSEAPTVPTAPTQSEAAFTDVLAGQWYSDAISWAAQKEIVNGIGNGQFAPNKKVTREQIATILRRYAAFLGQNTDATTDLQQFPDAKNVSQYATDAMRWAVEKDLIQGVADGDTVNLKPQGSAAREQVATILMRYLLTQTKQADTAA